MSSNTLIGEQSDTGRGGPERRRRYLTITVLAGAVAVIGLVAWIVADRDATSETTPTDEIQTVIDEYLAAWNSYDGEAFLEVTTDRYSLDMVGSTGSMTMPADEVVVLFETLEAFGWKEAVVGEPIMAGDGPWYVSVAEHFTGSGYGPEGADGVSTLTVVDDGGTLRIARHDYVGNN